MSNPVKLYVYDLSNGIARQLSLQLTGRQIDGIWHTSIVVFGKEIFYGQGISTTQPGKSHYGSPIRIVDMGETAIDKDTFDDYLAAMREQYTPDKYHLLNFNCNSFTNDCIGFLTGGSLPSYITSLPSDFLSTPFGQALRPTIDAMFTNRPMNGVPARPAAPSMTSPDPAFAASLAQSVAAQATTNGSSVGSAFSTHPPAASGSAFILPPPAASGSGFISPSPATSGSGFILPPPAASGSAFISPPPAASGSGFILPPPAASGSAFISPSPAASGSAFISPPPAAPAPAFVSPPPTAPGPIPRSRTMPEPDAPLTAPMHITTNPASFHSLLRSHRAVVAFFTSATCGPCRMIEPVFEGLAGTKSRANGGVGFAKIDLSVGLGMTVANEYQVRATPTFIFFLDGKKTRELKGVNAPELRTQVDLLIYEAFPPHAHTLLSLPAVEAVSLNPILFTQVPNLDTMFTKLAGFIDGVKSWTGGVTQAQVKQTLSKTVLPFLKASTATPPAQQLKSASFDHWPALTSSLAANLGPSELFPVVDIWRIALLNARFAAWTATTKVSESPLQRLMDKALQADNLPRNYLLTVLRMLANTFSNQVLAREVILFTREATTKLLVDALLHDDALVRTAAASLTFNIAAYLQRMRIDKVKARDDGKSPEESEEWELEIVVAVLGAIERETSSEETVHRLVACLGLLLRLSPYTEQVTGLLEALRAREVLKGKLEKGGCGEGGVAKKEVRKLVLEVAEKLCPL